MYLYLSIIIAAVLAIAGLFMLTWGIIEASRPPLEVRMHRAAEKLKRRHWQALEDFKHEIRKITRR